MIKKSILAACMALLPIWLCAQLHDVNRPFRYANLEKGDFGSLILNFLHNPPVLTKEKLPAYHAFFATAFSDSSGQLMFYMDGSGALWRNGQIIQENPESVYDGVDFIRGVFVLPAPGRPDIYYAVMTHHFLFPPPLSNKQGLDFKVIEPLANNGKGRAFYIPDQWLLSSIADENFIRIRAVKHGNGRDWWIISRKSGKQTSFYSILLSPEGFSDPVEYPIETESEAFLAGGFFSVSNNGTTLASRIDQNTLGLYAFDRCSGAITLYKKRSLPPGLNFGLSTIMESVFSPDDRFLYLLQYTDDRTQALLQVDLQEPGPFMHPTPVLQKWINTDDTPFLSKPVTAPDGKIYLTYQPYDRGAFLSVIHRPGLPGPACDAAYEYLSFPGLIEGDNHVYPNYRLGTWEASPCDTLPQHPKHNAFKHVPWPN